QSASRIIQAALCSRPSATWLAVVDAARDQPAHEGQAPAGNSATASAGAAGRAAAVSGEVLVVADVMLTMAHVAVVLANVLLWIPRRTRTLHAIVVGVTATSWFVLGPGLG